MDCLDIKDRMAAAPIIISGRSEITLRGKIDVSRPFILCYEERLHLSNGINIQSIRCDVVEYCHKRVPINKEKQQQNADRSNNSSAAAESPPEARLNLPMTSGTGIC